MTQRALTAPRIHKSITITSPPERVWNALTLPDQLPAWFCSEAVFEARPQGRVEWRWAMGPGEPTVGQATVTALSAPARLTLAAGEKSCWPNTRLDFVLTPDGCRTTLELTHEGFGADVDIEEVSRRWDTKLAALRHYAETGRLALEPWTSDQIRGRVLTDKMATMGAVFGLIAQKLGTEALGQLRDLQVKAHADYYRSLGTRSTLHFAHLFAQEHRNVYGEPVEVWGDASRVVIERHSRACYEQAQALGIPFDFVSFNRSGMEYMSALVRELGYSGEAKPTGYGFTMVLTR